MAFTKIAAAGISSSGSFTLENSTVTGVLTATSATVGSGITLSGTQINVGSATTIHSSGFRIGSSDIHSTGVSLQNAIIAGVTTVSAGSTAAPSISPTGDSNTGIFFPSADTVCIGEGGTEVLRVDSSGRLGIGTNNPQARLQVNGSVVKTSLDGLPVIFSSNDATNPFQLVFQRSASTDTVPVWSISSVEQSVAYRALSLQPNGGNTLIGMGGGNLGIGTNNPTATLDVFKTSYPEINLKTGSVTATFGIDTATNTLVLGSTTNNPLTLRTAGTDRLYLTSGGNIGIGIANPDSITNTGSPHLVVKGTGDLLIAQHTTLSSGEIALGPDYIFQNRNQSLRFGTNNAERARITSSGYIQTPNNAAAASGLDIGYQKYVSITGNFAANTWYNTGIDRTTDTGIYLVDAYIDTWNAGGQSYQVSYVGWFVMPNRGTNSGEAYGITLHRAGHAPNGETLQLRTLLTPNADGKIYLQWLSNFALNLNGNDGQRLLITLHRFATAVNNG